MRHANHCGGTLPVYKEAEEEDEEDEDEDEEIPVKRHKGEKTHFKINVVRTAFRKANITWALKYPRENHGAIYETLLKESIMEMEKNLADYVAKNGPVRVNFCLEATFVKSTDDSIRTNPNIMLMTEQFEIFKATKLTKIFVEGVKQLINRVVDFQSTGSGWVLDRMVSLNTTLWQFTPLGGQKWHKLSPWITRTKCVRNIKNTDNQCFMWAIIAGMYQPKIGKKSTDPSSYPKEAENFPDFTDTRESVTLTKIKTFEKNNPHVSVNVFATKEWKTHNKTRGIKRRKLFSKNFSTEEVNENESESENDDSKEEIDEIRQKILKRKRDFEEGDDNLTGYIFPIRITEYERENHVNLLLTEHYDNVHYSTIMNFDGLVRGQKSRNCFYCYSCFTQFHQHKGIKCREQCKELMEHKEFCKKLKPQRVTYPKDEVLSFTNLRKMRSAPFVVYTDFEAVLEKGDNVKSTDIGLTELSGEERSMYQKHKPVSWYTRVSSEIDLKLKDEGDEFIFPQKEPFIGENAAEAFLDYLTILSRKIYDEIICKPKKMIITDKEEKEFLEADECWICNMRFPNRVHHVHNLNENEEKCEHCISNKKYNYQKQFHNYGELELHCHNKGETDKTCSICQKNGDIKVRDHSHITGLYRGAAHRSCNLQFNLKPKAYVLPVVLHNFRGYDCHFIVNALKERHGKVNIIATNIEKFLSMRVGRLRFLDSMQFTLMGIDKLAETMENSDFNEMKKEFSGKKGREKTLHCHKKWENKTNCRLCIENREIEECEKFGDELPMYHCHNKHENENNCDWCIINKRVQMFDLLRRKGIFCYDYFSSLTVLEEKELPSQEKFHGILNDEDCSDYSYWVAKKLWDDFNMTSFKCYHNLYLKLDVLILQDFFEKFRKTCMNNFNLEPLAYFSTPGFAYDAALKFTGVKLELLEDPGMYTMVERGIRGGVSQINLREASANNELMENYDENMPLVHLIYLDCNNLYGTSMIENLPTGGFKWVERSKQQRVIEFDSCDGSFHMSDIDLNGEKGYLLEVDLIIPEEIHDKTNDMPLAAENLVVEEKMLSPFQQTFPKYAKEANKKLAPNMFKKTRYVTHARNLQFYEQMGAKIDRVHKVLQFNQSKWLAAYINFNTDRRAESSSTFGKNYYKLMNNAVFGKSVENVRNRINIKLARTKKEALKIASKTNMLRSVSVTENLAVFEVRVEKLKLCKPIYVGMTILDLSKLYMLEFHYKKMKKWFKNIQLCFSDTDSYLYRIEGEDIYNVIMKHKEDFDLSDYPKSHECFSNENKKRLGRWKDELQGQIILQFIGLRAKSYSILYADYMGKHREKQVSKGTKSAVRKRFLRHNKYKEVLLTMKKVCVSQNGILSVKHNLGTYNQERVALSGYDTKRYICKCGKKTLAHGHYLTKTNC